MYTYYSEVKLTGMMEHADEEPWVMVRILYKMRYLTGNQWSSSSAGVTWSYLLRVQSREEIV